MRRGAIATAGVALLAAGLPGDAHALLCGTVLSPVSVSATNVAFGSYLPTSSGPVTATGDITIRCALVVDLLPSFTVSLSTGGAGGFSPRKMATAGSQLDYNLYTATDYATVWGDGTGVTQTVTKSSTLQLNSVPLTVQGRIPAGQWVRAGAYQDTILVTVSY